MYEVDVFCWSLLFSSESWLIDAPCVKVSGRLGQDLGQSARPRTHAPCLLLIGSGKALSRLDGALIHGEMLMALPSLLQQVVLPKLTGELLSGAVKARLENWQISMERRCPAQSN